MSSPLRPILRGLRLRCPACGEGRMSPTRASFVTLEDACPRCGTRFEPARGEWSGALMLAQGVYGGVALFGVLAMLLIPLPLAWIVAWIALTTVVLPIVTYRHLKGAWIGLMWAAQPWTFP